jgi:acyl-CoA reductase-like NAD-dependent aldehyde dehydrogenase
MMESAVGLVGFYINGVWEKPQGRTTLPVTNPATGAVLAEAPYATADDVDRAVRTAHDAFLKWREVPVVDRVQVLYRFKTLLEEHAAEVAAILTRENGKTAEDARMEVRRAIQMVEVACGMPSLMMGDSLNDVAKDEIFGPVLSVIRVKTLDEAIQLVNRSPFGNATSIFTSNGKAAREYSSRIEVGMVGVNVGVAAPMAFFPFAGWKNSFFGDLHAHGKDAVAFYTEQKVIMSRWF